MNTIASMSSPDLSTWFTSLWRFLVLASNPFAKAYGTADAIIRILGFLGFAAAFLPRLEPYRWQIVASVAFVFIFSAGFRLQREKDRLLTQPLSVEGMTSGKRYAILEITNTREATRTFTAQVVKVGDSSRTRSLPWGIGDTRLPRTTIQRHQTDHVTIGRVGPSNPRPPNPRFRLMVMRPRGQGDDYPVTMPAPELDANVRISADDGEVTDLIVRIRRVTNGVETEIVEQTHVG